MEKRTLRSQVTWKQRDEGSRIPTVRFPRVQQPGVCFRGAPLQMGISFSSDLQLERINETPSRWWTFPLECAAAYGRGALFPERRLIIVCQRRKTTLAVATGYPVTALCRGTRRQCELEGAQRGGGLCHHRVHAIWQPDTEPTDALPSAGVSAGRLIGGRESSDFSSGRRAEQGGRVQTGKK